MLAVCKDGITLGAINGVCRGALIAVHVGMLCYGQCAVASLPGIQVSDILCASFILVEQTALASIVGLVACSGASSRSCLYRCLGMCRLGCIGCVDLYCAGSILKCLLTDRAANVCKLAGFCAFFVGCINIDRLVDCISCAGNDHCTISLISSRIKRECAVMDSEGLSGNRYIAIDDTIGDNSRF